MNRILEIIKKPLTWLFVGGVALAAPIIPADMEWVKSYETVGFTTVTQDLNVNQYAVSKYAPDGVTELEWYINNKGGIIYVKKR